MKTRTITIITKNVVVFATAGVIGVAVPTMAQTQQESIAQSLDVSVFPSNGQMPEQQNKDEGTCYNWAVSDSGVDPFKVQKQQAADAAQSQQDKQDISAAGKGAGARGAVGGAAIGGLVGAIADTDAGKDAAIGAAVGGIMSRRRMRKEQEEATQDVDTQQQQAQQVSTADMNHFKQSFSVCLKSKNYMVEY